MRFDNKLVWSIKFRVFKAKYNAFSSSTMLRVSIFIIKSSAVVLSLNYKGTNI